MHPYEITPVKCLAFILDISSFSPARDGKSGFRYVKDAVIERIAALESDDLVYIFRSEGELEIGRTLAESVAIVNDMMPPKRIIVSHAVEECMALQSQYEDAKSVVIYITDRYTSNNDGLFQDVMTWAASKQFECPVYAYGIGQKYHKSLLRLKSPEVARYHSRHIDDYSELQKVLLQDFGEM